MCESVGVCAHILSYIEADLHILLWYEHASKTEPVLMYAFTCYRSVLCVLQGFPGFPGYRGMKGEKGNLFLMNIKGETCSRSIMQCSVHRLS